jgi:hypothetical protein
MRLKRTKETGGTLSKEQQKALDSYDAQHAKLGSTIFNLESKIYDVGGKSDLASVAASGSGDRPFRGFSKEEGEHAGMFEAKSREKAAAEQKAAIDKLEAEWAARERQRTERDPRKPEQPEAKPTGDGTDQAAPVRDQAFDTNPDGFVNSTNGNPIHFGHQRDAGWWILKQGNKQSARQVFEIANHPSGKGFTVRETHKTDGGEPGAKQSPPGEGGAVAVRGNSPRSDPETARASEDLLSLANDVKNNPSNNARRVISFGTASDIAIGLFKSIGIDVTGFPHVVDNSAIRHGFKNHGDAKAEQSRGQEAITAEDFARIPEVLASPDSVMLDGETNIGRKAILYKKRFNGHLLVVEEVRTGKGQLALTSIRKTRATPDAPSEPAPKSPAQTSETFRAKSGESIAEPLPSRNDAEPKAVPTPKAPRERPARLRTLLQSIRSWGGISPYYREGLTGERRGSFANVFREGGLGMDEVSRRMYDDGFLTHEHMTDEADNEGINHATDMVTRAIYGEDVHNVHDSIAVAAQREKADYKQHLVDEIKEKGIKTKRYPDFHTVEELQAAIAEHDARQEAKLDALDKDMADAYTKAEAALGDRFADVIKPNDGSQSLESWYRENIDRLNKAIEDEHAYNEHVGTGESAARETEGDSESAGAQSHGGSSEKDAGSQAGRADRADDSRPDFGLERQSEAGLKAKADAEAQAKAEKESAQRKAEAADKKAADQKETDEREARVMAEREAAKKAEIDAGVKDFGLGQDPPKPVETKVSKDEAAGQKDLLSGDGKSDAGTLYANPFHKALGWAFGDSNAWAASLTEFGKSIRELARAGANGIKENPLVSFVRAVFDSSSADIRAVVRKGGASKTAQWVIDQFHDEAGSGRATGETYGEAVNAKVNTRMVELHRLLGNMIPDDGAMRQLANMIRSGSARAGTKLGDAAIGIRKMLDDELKYLRDAGVDLGEVKNGYFPREYVTDKIIKHGQKFIDGATQAYVESGMTRANAILAAKELHDSLVYGEHGNIFKSVGGSGQAPFLKGRTFGKQIDNPSHPLNEFLNHDAAEVLTQYFQRAAKRAEIARRFGDNFSHWRDYSDTKGTAGKFGAKQEGILTRIEKEGGQAALTKLQEYVSLAAGIRAYGIGPGGMRTTSIMRTWGALSFLEKATLSSLGEFIVPAMRSGNVLDAGRGLVNVLNDLFIKTKDAKARRAIAEDLGMIAGHIDSALSAARFAGGQPVGKIESKVLHRFFLRTGLTPWTDATRVAATDTGRVFIRRLAKDLSGKLNTRYLADLGIPADKVDAFKAFVLSKSDGMPGTGDLKGEMGDLYRTAVRKFVSQSIMNPAATAKPSWMSHPIGAVMGQLQSFNYAFYENVIKRTVRLLKESTTGEGYTGLERAKMVMPLVISPLLVAAQYAIGEGRDALLGDPNRREKETEKDKLLKAFSRGLPIAPLDPLINYISSAKYQRGAAQSFAGPVGGVAATGLDAGRDAFLNNSDKTNTQERAAAKAVWDIFIEPAVNLALYSTPVSPISAVVTQAAGSGHVRENLFVTPLAGPKKQPGEQSQRSQR